MKRPMLLRYLTLTAMLAVTLPVPASAQFGGIKRRLKEKIVGAAVDSVVGRAVGPDSVGTPGSGTSKRASAPRARKGTPTPAAATGPRFDEWVLEITPDLLDRLERGLAAQAAVRKAAAGNEKFSSSEKWENCRQALLERVQKKFQALAVDGDEEKALEYFTAFQQHEKERILSECGVAPTDAPRLRNEAEVEAYRRGIAASGLTDRPYGILRERVQPFCALTGAAEAAGSAFRIPAGGGEYLVYTPSEIEAMKPLCARLMPLFKTIT